MTTLVPKQGLFIAPCRHSAARSAVMRWHYSKCMPNGKLSRWGVWEDGVFVGAIIYGGSATPNLLKPYGLHQGEGCELVRVALNGRQHTHTSRIVAISLRLLKKAYPGLRIIISFADPKEGHHGGIYQAMGWTYLGTSETSRRRIFLNGRIEHPRSLGSRYGKGGQSIQWLRDHVDPQAAEVLHPAKHRYAFPLDAAMTDMLKERRQPYPKRAPEAEVYEASTFQVAEGGSSPTQAHPQ